MTAVGTVEFLFTSPTDGDSSPHMQRHSQIECVAGRGILGDRYFFPSRLRRPVVIGGTESDLCGRYDERQNTHWHLPEAGRQLTLFDSAALHRLQESSGLVLSPEACRRYADPSDIRRRVFVAPLFVHAHVVLSNKLRHVHIFPNFSGT